MADTLQLDLASPERRLASVQTPAVQIPGSDGDMTAMPGHAPTITTLRPGILIIEGVGGAETQTYLVTGGFADVADQTATILAEFAVPVADVTNEMWDTMIFEATAKRDAASDTTLDAEAKKLADLQAARDAIVKT